MSGAVYFLQAQPDGLIKIGFTTAHVNFRAKALQAASPYELKWIGYFAGTVADEKAAHALLAAHRFRNEWFHPAPEVLAFIHEKCPGFDEAAYLREVFHDEHRLALRSIPHCERGYVAEMVGLYAYDLIKWIMSERTFDKATAARIGAASRKYLAERRQSMS